ncbi:hypothetical protein WMZ97_16945 [Lentibacillus sp. N15]|uniref:hypothetical protein n=1 Tax=Lentibacillus songyuanensis TaxID=3136161 RepID=UPI0031BB2D76
MKKYYEARHIFISISIVVAVAAPIFLLFVPIAIANNVHYTKENWFVFLSPSVYWLYGAGFFLLLVAALLPAIFYVKKIPVSLSIMSVVLSLFVFYAASQHHQVLSDNAISYQPLFSQTEYTYSWDNLKRVVHHANIDGSTSKYVFQFKDGNKLTIRDNGYFENIKIRLRHKLQDQGIQIKAAASG